MPRGQGVPWRAGVEFDAVNVHEPDGRERWVAAGRPIVPSLLVDGVASPILHVSQLASMLGLEAPSQLEVSRLAWDATAVLDAWPKLIGRLDFETLIVPTPSRGRSLRNLTVNVFHPVELLPPVRRRRFDWDPTATTSARHRCRTRTRSRLRERPLRRWQDWLLSARPTCSPGPRHRLPARQVTYTNLLDSQRWHAAFHYRQLLAFLERVATT